MTKPDWCPQWAWDEAWQVTAHHWASDTGYRRAMAIQVARALLEAERRGMERAAVIAEGEAHTDCEVAEQIARMIRSEAKGIEP